MGALLFLIQRLLQGKPAGNCAGHFNEPREDWILVLENF